MDPLDVVCRYYAAFNRGDLAALLDLYHEDVLTEGSILLDEAAAEHRGREANRVALETFFREFEGALDAGASIGIGSQGIIETGWAHAEWRAAIRARGSTEVRHLAGYHQFLIEDGLIRRQNGVIHEVDAPPAALPGPAPSSRAYPSRPIVGVGAVVWVDGKIVLIRRKYEPLAGQWSLPGGTLELGETLEAGVAREVFEETGIEVSVGPVVDVFDRILLDEEKKVRYHFVLIDYLCRPTGGRVMADSDVTDAVLVDPKEVDAYRLTPKAVAVIRRAVRMVQEEACGDEL